MNENWVNNKFEKEDVLLKVRATAYFRIPRHRNELIKELQKTIRDLDVANRNIIVKSVSILKGDK
jgi:hypothetical protein